jgi:hypothetical protein
MHNAIKAIVCFCGNKNLSKLKNMGKNKDGNYEEHNSNNVFPDYETCAFVEIKIYQN